MNRKGSLTGSEISGLMDDSGLTTEEWWSKHGAS